MVLRLSCFLIAILTFPVFAQIAHFTENRDVLVTAVGPLVVARSSYYKSTNKGADFIVAKDSDYRMIYKKNPDGSLMLTEISRTKNSANPNFGWAQVALVNKDKQVESVSNCGTLDWDRKSILAGQAYKESFLRCATATEQVCAEVKKIGAFNLQQMHEKIRTCQTLTQVQTKLANLMREKNYLRTSQQNLKTISDNYMEFIRPDPSLMNKALDEKEVQAAIPPVNFDLEQVQKNGVSLDLLFRTCEKMYAVSARQGLSHFDEETAVAQ